MNNSKLLRVGVPALGLCVFAAFQTGCRSEVFGERRGVPPAEKEKIAEEAASIAPDKAPAVETAAPAPVAKAAKKYTYPKFEDTAHTPIYSKPKKARKVKSATAAPGSLYTVVSGDTLGGIAIRHRVKTIDLAKANDLQLTSVIRVGQKLRIPGGKAVVADASTTVKTVDAPATRSGLYVVRKGDSISRIAKRLKIKRADLMQANNLTEQSILRIGQTLKLPGAEVVNGESVIVDTAAPAPAPEVKVETPAPAAEKDKMESEVLSEIGDAAAPVTAAPAKDAAASATAAAAAAAAPAAPGGTSIEVYYNISLDDFCKRYSVSKEDVMRLNKGVKADTVIKAGEVIIIP